MKNSSEVFKSIFDYYQLVASKKIAVEVKNLANLGKILQKVANCSKKFHSPGVYVFIQTNMIFQNWNKFYFGHQFLKSDFKTCNLWYIP